MRAPFIPQEQRLRSRAVVRVGDDARLILVPLPALTPGPEIAMHVNIGEKRTGDPTLRATPLGGGEPALLDHTRRQPLRDQPPGGERADLP